MLLFYRLVNSEPVQYFQFDQMGNMYVYEPGSGYSGEAKLVPPSCELDKMSNSWSEIASSCQSKMLDSAVITTTSFEKKSQISQELVKVETVAENR